MWAHIPALGKFIRGRGHLFWLLPTPTPQSHFSMQRAPAFLLVNLSCYQQHQNVVFATFSPHRHFCEGKRGLVKAHILRINRPRRKLVVTRPALLTSPLGLKSLEKDNTHLFKPEQFFREDAAAPVLIGQLLPSMAEGGQ